MDRYKKKSFYFIAICFLLLFSVPGWGQLSKQQEIDVLTARLEQMALTRGLNIEGVESSLSQIQSDGSWPDINYDEVTQYYDAKKHLTRLIQMSLAYRKPESGSYYQAKSLLDKIQLGLNYFYQTQPTSKNWWYIDIGAPQDYMVVLLLLKKEIDKEELMYYSSYLKDRTDNPAHQGKNRTWVSEITLWKGCIEDNYELIEIGINSIASTVKIIYNSNEEGIKADYSIHQHRPQLYSGGYGMGFMEDLNRFIHLSNGLSFSWLFTEEKKDIITKTMLEGQILFGYRDSYDFGTIGRNISRPNALSNISPEMLDAIIANDSLYKPKYQAWKRNIEGGPFPVPGNKYFWKSAIMTHHGDNYYLSAKVPSVRNNGTEMLNGENLMGYYLPLGATNILTTGDEYRNIFPVWDWTRIPGTTAIANQSTAELRWYHFGSNRFAGGTGNSKNGIMAYEHAYTGVQAWKSYFFLGDAMLCLGSGINAAKTQMVITSVNQCFLRGDVYINRAGKTEKFTREKEKLDDLNWIHHDNVGYIFPDQKNIVLQQKEQQGSWKMINESGDPRSIAHKVFSIWKEHGYTPVNESYCYIIIPDKSLVDFEKEAGRYNFEIIANSPEIQAVKNPEMQHYGIVFYQPGKVELERDFVLTSDKPLIIYMEKLTDGYELSVADPLFVEESVTLTINQKLEGLSVQQDKKGSVINIKLPDEDYRGSVVTVRLKQ